MYNDEEPCATQRALHLVTYHKIIVMGVRMPCHVYNPPMVCMQAILSSFHLSGSNWCLSCYIASESRNWQMSCHAVGRSWPLGWHIAIGSCHGGSSLSLSCHTAVGSRHGGSSWILSCHIRNCSCCWCCHCRGSGDCWCCHIRNCS